MKTHLQWGLPTRHLTTMQGMQVGHRMLQAFQESAVSPADSMASSRWSILLWQWPGTKTKYPWLMYTMEHPIRS